MHDHNATQTPPPAEADSNRQSTSPALDQPYERINPPEFYKLRDDLRKIEEHNDSRNVRYDHKLKCMVPMTAEEIAVRAERRAKEEADRQSRNLALRRSYIGRQREQAGIPMKYTAAMDQALACSASSGSQSERSWKQHYDFLSELLSKRRGKPLLIVCCGPTGPGKSQMCAALLYRAIEMTADLIQAADPDDGYHGSKTSALWLAARDLFHGIQACYQGAGVTVESVLAKYNAPQTLVIDELRETLSEHDCRMLQDIIGNRYDWQKHTIINTNATRTAIVEALGPRVADRLVECGGAIEFDWPSFRKAS